MLKRIAALFTTSAVLAITVTALTNSASAAPKAGGSCAKKELNKKSGDLVCQAKGKKFAWAAKTGSTPTTAATPATKELSGSVKVDGSSTVFPLAEAAAELFGKDGVGKKVKVTVGESGTGGGFKKFCAGETDISNASRSITDAEKKACADKGITFKEFTVANDGLSLVVNPSNNFAECLTVAQLKKIWNAGSTINNWKDVDPLFPDVAIKLFGAGTASGTFDFFSEAINGKAKVHRTDYNATEDDNVTVVGVGGSPGGLGYFGLSYALENANKVKLVAVDNGSGKCVKPSKETVQDGTYKPLGRPLFIYVSSAAMKRPEVLGFTEYFLGNLDDLTKRALFIPLTPTQKTATAAALEELKKL
jgi:phosphate transport system substrate-binding protein